MKLKGKLIALLAAFLVSGTAGVYDVQRTRAGFVAEPVRSGHRFLLFSEPGGSGRPAECPESRRCKSRIWLSGIGGSGRRFADLPAEYRRKR